jgi:anti-sigma B factor antagonist
MKIEARETNGVTLLVLVNDRLDAHNSDLVKGRLRDVFASGAKDVVVDLSEVRFIDSSGLGAMVSGFKNAVSHHGRLVLSGLQTQPRSMFDLTRLTRVFDIYENAEAALGSFAGQ